MTGEWLHWTSAATFAVPGMRTFDGLDGRRAAVRSVVGQGAVALLVGGSEAGARRGHLVGGIRVPSLRLAVTVAMDWAGGKYERAESAAFRALVVERVAGSGR